MAVAAASASEGKRNAIAVASQQKESYRKICIMVIMEQCELHANMHIVIVIVIDTSKRC